MSIVIASCGEKYVALCADCQHTNVRTGLSEEVNLKKIERLSPHLFVAHCGSAAMAELCMIPIRKLCADGQLSNSSVEAIANALKTAYECGLKKRPDLEDLCTTKFIIAGKLQIGCFGFIVVESEKRIVTAETFDYPTAKLYGPADMSSKECASIMDTLAHSEPVISIPEYVENVCRKTVQTVSTKSNYVSYDSIFEIYSEY